MRRLLMLAALAVAGIASVGAGAAAANASLPDNRGWEIVTPPDQGDDVVPVFWSSHDGSMTAFKSLSSFAGGLNGGAEGYVARRGADGWTAQAMTPPGSALGTTDAPQFTPVGVSSDGSQVIWSGGYNDFNQSRDVFLGTGIQTAVNMSASVRPAADSAIYVGATPDAGHVAFGVYPPFGGSDAPLLYDYTGGSARPVGILPGQTAPNPGGAVLGSFERNYGTGSVFNAVSDDGSRIFFESPAPPSVGSGQLPNPTGLYVRENGTTTKQIDANAIYWNASPNGATVLYTPADGSGDLGLATYDVSGEQPTQIAPTSAQVQGVAGTSDDLSRVYFVALGDLADGATAGQGNLYLYDKASDTPVRYVATVNPTSSGGYAEGARFSSKDLYSGGAITSMASADGRLLAWVSTRQLTGYDNQGVREVYVFDADATTDPIACISCSTDGADPIDDSYLQTQTYVAPPQVDTGVVQLIAPPTNITVDDRRVFFETSNALDPQDQNGTVDVYEWQDGRAHLLSSGTGTEARFVGASSSGDDVFFTTKNALTWQAKSSNLRSIYDARVGGGIPEPVATPLCELDQTCQGPASQAPSVPVAGSASFQSSGNVVERPGAAKRGKQAPAFRVGAIGRKARARLARTGRLTVRVRIGAAGTVTVRMRARVGKRMRTVAHATRRARHAGTVRVKLRLSKAARRELRRGHRLRVRAVVRYSKVHANRHASFVVAGAEHERGR